MVGISYHWWNSKFQRDSQVASALMKNKLRAGLRVTFIFIISGTLKFLELKIYEKKNYPRIIGRLLTIIEILSKVNLR